MKQLTNKQKRKISYYVKKTNEVIEQEQLKSAHRFLISKLKFINDFQVQCNIRTDNLSDANELGDILFAGVRDLISIVAKDGFGMGEYIEISDEYHNAVENFQDEFPLFIEIEITNDITSDIEKLLKKKKDKTTYYKKLIELKEDIAKIRQVLNKRHNIHKYLRKLVWKFIKINLAITKTIITPNSTNDEIKKLERETIDLCKKLIKATKKYDTRVAGIKKIDKLKEIAFVDI